MMPQGVKCSVSNCAFWKQGNNCNAEQIMIDIDQHASAHYDTEFAEDGLSSNHKDLAENSSVTCCHTFRPQG